MVTLDTARMIAHCLVIHKKRYKIVDEKPVLTFFDDVPEEEEQEDVDQLLLDVTAPVEVPGAGEDEESAKVNSSEKTDELAGDKEEVEDNVGDQGSGSETEEKPLRHSSEDEEEDNEDQDPSYAAPPDYNNSGEESDISLGQKSTTSEPKIKKRSRSLRTSLLPEVQRCKVSVTSRSANPGDESVRPETPPSEQDLPRPSSVVSTESGESCVWSVSEAETPAAPRPPSPIPPKATAYAELSGESLVLSAEDDVSLAEQSEAAKESGAKELVEVKVPDSSTCSFPGTEDVEITISDEEEPDVTGPPEARMTTGSPEARPDVTGPSEAGMTTSPPEAGMTISPPEARPDVTGPPEAGMTTGPPEAEPDVTGPPEARKEALEPEGSKPPNKDRSNEPGMDLFVGIRF